MSVNKMLTAGFGPGGTFGTATTTSVTGTLALGAGQWIVVANSAVGTTTGVFITASSTTNGVTATYVILGANQPGEVLSDGSSVNMIGTATVCLISL